MQRLFCGILCNFINKNLQMKNVLIFLAAILFLGACSVQSRKYRPGYHIESLAKSKDKPMILKKTSTSDRELEKNVIETSALSESIVQVDLESKIIQPSLEDKKTDGNYQLFAKSETKPAKKNNIISKTLKRIQQIPNKQKEKLMQQIQLAKGNNNFPVDMFNGGGGILDIIYAFIGAMVAFTIMYLLIFFIIVILLA